MLSLLRIIWLRASSSQFGPQNLVWVLIASKKYIREGKVPPPSRNFDAFFLHQALLLFLSLIRLLITFSETTASLIAL